MLEGAKLVDAQPHAISGEQTIEMAKDYEFLVLFTSTPGFPGDIRLAQAIKDVNPRIKICFVGPHVSVLPEKSLKEATAVDFVARKEFDHTVVEFAQGKPLEEILGISYRKNGGIVPALNTAAGTPTVAPECASLASNALGGGGSESVIRALIAALLRSTAPLSASLLPP